ncbi:hypothetical protein EDC01DRAFT_759996 [Geopyxis carbonaria]|nr:hypothetical protein EDC01DRAFT_759996 [Geopyxis carbonaria]
MSDSKNLSRGPGFEDSAIISCGAALSKYGNIGAYSRPWMSFYHEIHELALPRSQRPVLLTVARLSAWTSTVDNSLARSLSAQWGALKTSAVKKNSIAQELIIAKDAPYSAPSEESVGQQYTCARFTERTSLEFDVNDVQEPEMSRCSFTGDIEDDEQYSMKHESIMQTQTIQPEESTSDSRVELSHLANSAPKLRQDLSLKNTQIKTLIQVKEGGTDQKSGVETLPGHMKTRRTKKDKKKKKKKPGLIAVNLICG